MSQHFGIWRGPALQSHGMSRSHQYQIETATGGIIWSVEKHSYALGTRVKFNVGHDLHGIEQLAMDVEPVDILVSTLADLANKAEPNKAATPASKKPLTGGKPV